MWPDRRLMDLFKIAHPIVLAPMAGAMDADLVIEVCEAGGLGSLPVATLDERKMREEIAKIRSRTKKPLNVNFFCHTPPELNNAREARWRDRLMPYYEELGIDPAAPVPSSNRTPFDAALCAAVEELKPEVVSFHFGLPDAALLKRVKQAGCVVLSSATTAEEARWLERRGVDAVIAQGNEAGGHRGMFLTEDVGTQVGTFALVPQVVDAVKVPVIAAGAITDARGIAAALALGAAGVQVGTAYLFCPEFEDFGAAPRCLEGVAQRQHGADQPDDRASGARHRQSADARNRPDQHDRAGVPARRWCTGAAARQGGGPKLGRFLAAMVGPSGVARPRDAGAGTHRQAR